MANQVASKDAPRRGHAVCTYAKKDRNGPSSANQVASKDAPRRSHAVLSLHPSGSLAIEARPSPRTRAGRVWSLGIY